MTALSLQNYDINPTISGKVLTYMLDSRDLSLVQAAKDCGIPYDAFRNCLKGEVQTVSLDRILKVCYVTEYTIYDYFRFYYEIEQTHIFDKVVYLCGSSACPKQESAKIADDIPAKSADRPENSADPSEKSADPSAKSSGLLCPNADHVRQHIDELQQGYVDKLVRQYENMMQQLRDQIQQLKDSRELMKSQYEATVKLLNERYGRSVKHMNGEIEKLEKEKDALFSAVEKSNRRIRWLSGVLIVENIVLVGVFAYDFMNRSIGWIRSFYDRTGAFTIKS